MLKEVRRKTCCRVVCGMILFVLVSLFCCGYLVVFSHVANPQSSLSIAIDLVIFEIFPAIVVGMLGVVYLGCKVKCVMWLIVSIEAYRFLRNFVDT